MAGPPGREFSAESGENEARADEPGASRESNARASDDTAPDDTPELPSASIELRF
jgi:hypothetical protein